MTSDILTLDSRAMPVNIASGAQCNTYKCNAMLYWCALLAPLVATPGYGGSDRSPFGGGGALAASMSCSSFSFVLFSWSLSIRLKYEYDIAPRMVTQIPIIFFMTSGEPNSTNPPRI